LTALAILEALWAAASWALGSVYFSRALSGPHAPTPAAANTFKNVLALCLFGALLLGSGDALRPDLWPPASAIALLIASGVLGFAFGDSLYFAAITRCGIQTASSITLLYVPLAAVLGWLVYGTQLAPLELAGLALALLGVGLVITDPRTTLGGLALDPAQRRAGVALSFGVVVVIAVAVVLGAGESQEAGLFHMAFLRMSGGVLGAGLIAPLLAWRSRRSIRRELADLSAPLRAAAQRPRPLWTAVGLALAGLVPYHHALRELPVGVSAVLFATTPLFALVFGRLAGERFGRRGRGGALVGFAGIALIVLAARG